MNNFELGGLILHVGKAVIGGPLSEGMKAIDKLPPLPAGATPPPPIVTSPSVSAAGMLRIDIIETSNGLVFKYNIIIL
jgi:hypothetical protein